MRAFVELEFTLVDLGDRLSEIFTLALKKNSKTTGGAASSKGRRGYHPSQR
jgi:hypothetical protein